ncbi:hypothetical protein D770_24670 [Flammeovirgaceae bacterium 311]|nr:hypothetical protein D770_24670 [Flammeovirgaceae bacterium 311]
MDLYYPGIKPTATRDLQSLAEKGIYISVGGKWWTQHALSVESYDLSWLNSTIKTLSYDDISVVRFTLTKLNFKGGSVLINVNVNITNGRCYELISKNLDTGKVLIIKNFKLIR